MKIEETFNELTVRETPGCLWLFGLFFAFVGGIFVYGSLGGFTNADEIPRYGLYLAFLMGAVAVCVGVWVIFRAPATKVVVNRQTKTIVHTRRGIFGTDEKIYKFDSLKQFRLIEERDGDGDPIWSLGMELNGGETIKISSLESRDEKYKRDFVFQINSFTGRQMPSSQVFDELKDETVGKIS